MELEGVKFSKMYYREEGKYRMIYMWFIKKLIKSTGNGQCKPILLSIKTELNLQGICMEVEMERERGRELEGIRAYDEGF